MPLEIVGYAGELHQGIERALCGTSGLLISGRPPVSIRDDGCGEDQTDECTGDGAVAEGERGARYSREPVCDNADGGTCGSAILLWASRGDGNRQLYAADTTEWLPGDGCCVQVPH